MDSINTGTNSWLSNIATAQKRQNLTPIKSEQPSLADKNSTKAVDKVSFSQKLQKALDPNSKPKPQGQMITGDDMIIEWGIMILGGKEQIKNWEEKGLVITEDTYRAINDAFNKSSKEVFALQAKHPKRSFGATFNPYQIIQDNQTTPDWFHAEKEAFIQATGDPKAQAAFREGKHYLVSDNKGHSKDALAAYRMYNRKGQKEDEELENNKRFEMLKKALEQRSLNQKEQTDMGAGQTEKIEKSDEEKYPDAPDNRVVEGTDMSGLSKA